ncbi:MAG: hypothetical protein QGH15_15640 [Kiritimatiellia bacterium]|nr:hypothetical protein [Kiritimatiellia bacterium]
MIYVISRHQYKSMGGGLLRKYLQAQVENSLELGWAPRDVIIATSFPFNHMGVNNTLLNFADNDINASCNKVLGAVELLEKGIIGEAWMHDLDAWQMTPFGMPEIKALGMVPYLGGKRLNSGSVFLNEKALPVLRAVLATARRAFLDDGETIPDETAFRRSGRIVNENTTRLNTTFNVGRTGFAKRYTRATKPVKVVHAHFEKEKNWKRFVLGKNPLHTRVVDERLERILSGIRTG